MNHTLYHRVEQIRDSLTEARKTATDPKLIEALTAGIDDLSAFMLDLQDDEPDETDEDTTATTATAQRTLADELWQFGCALQYAHMAVWE